MDDVLAGVMGRLVLEAGSDIFRIKRLTTEAQRTQRRCRWTLAFLLTTDYWELIMMQGEIIATGAELITGRMADSNAGYIARRLHEAGLTACPHHGGGPGPPLIREVLEAALGRSRFIIITGGLGPTEDDLSPRPCRGPGPGAGRSGDPRGVCLARLRRCLGKRQIPWAGALRPAWP